MRCIFCTKEREPSLEHVFPLAIGGSLTTDRVCRPCNSKLGNTVDTYLTTHPLVVAQRARFKLAGNSGTVPDPFRALIQNAVLDDGSGQRVRVYGDADGRMVAHLIHQEQEHTSEEGVKTRETRIDGRDADRLATIVTRQRARDGMAPLGVGAMDRAIADMIAAKEVIRSPRIRGEISIDTDRYRLGVLKIVYELAVRWCGERIVDTDWGKRVRDVLTDGTALGDAELSGFIGFGPGLVLRRWPGSGHVAMCLPIAGRSIMLIRIFREIHGVLDLGPVDLPDGPMIFRSDPVEGTQFEGPAGPDILRRDLEAFKVTLLGCSGMTPVRLAG